MPPDFSESKRYPLVINVYGGPNSQQVNDRFKLDWGTYLTTSEGIIYGLIDGRGSGFKGQTNTKHRETFSVAVRQLFRDIILMAFK